jgi:phosphopantetheinyl transferase (holo-ACP synthase)
MNQMPAYKKFIGTIEKGEFISLFNIQKPDEWFTEKELLRFTLPGNTGSLAGRYLIKKTICDNLKEVVKMSEIEILNDDFGKPEILLSPIILRASELAGIKNILCSISHSRNFIATMTLFCI